MSTHVQGEAVGLMSDTTSEKVEERVFAPEGR